MTESVFEQYKAALRRGHLAAIDGRLDEALDAYEAAGRLVPGRSLPHASQGTVLHRLGRWDEAQAAFDAALQLSPDDEAGLRARATARDERGLAAGAAADYERLAFVLDVAGRSSEAAAAARRAAELEPTGAREALAGRLTTAAASAPDPGSRGTAMRQPVVPEPAVMAPQPGDASPEEPSASVPPDRAADDEIDAEAEAAWAAVAERFQLERVDEDAPLALATPKGPPAREPAIDAFDLDEARAALVDEHDPASEGGLPAPEPAPEPAAVPEADLAAEADAATEAAAFPGLEQEPEPSPALETVVAATAAQTAEDGAEGGEEQHDWPPVDLPTIPPPPLDGPAPDPEQLLALATAAIEARDLPGARDMLLTAVLVHRQEGRIDAALEVCLHLLEIAPGDPQVHIAIANLQLDRGWTELAKEKIDLLLRLTSLTGDTQSEADVHFLASERLRDDPVTSTAAR